MVLKIPADAGEMLHDRDVKRFATELSPIPGTASAALACGSHLTRAQLLAPHLCVHLPAPQELDADCLLPSNTNLVTKASVKTVRFGRSM